MGRLTFAIGLFWHPLKQESDASIRLKQRWTIDEGDCRVAPLCQRVGFLPLVGREESRVWRTWGSSPIPSKAEKCPRGLPRKAQD